MTPKKVLIVEDDLDLVELLQIHLSDLHCDIYVANDGLDGLHKATSLALDLVILDVMLPGKDGIEICREIRAQKIITPIMMLTAKSDEIDKVLGLETGADDYLTKPFGIREFISRVKALFRRHELLQGAQEAPKVSSVIRHKDLEIDPDKRKVLSLGKVVDLTPKEFELLVLFCSHPGRAFSREELLSMVWGYEFNGYEHTVNSHINRLRSKIEPDVSEPTYILTSWGVGYKFNDELS